MPIVAKLNQNPDLWLTDEGLIHSPKEKWEVWVAFATKNPRQHSCIFSKTQKKPEKGSLQDLSCSSLTLLDLLMSSHSALNYQEAQYRAWNKSNIFTRRNAVQCWGLSVITLWLGHTYLSVTLSYLSVSTWHCLTSHTVS